jgi:glycosyltransferase involved in cell wall biosynthesis
MIWFLTEIFPLIREKLGDVSLTIAGVNQSERIRNLAGPNIRVTGRLEDLNPLYAEARVFIAPTRYAAGIPHKIHEAASRGLPVVATSLLATQLGWTEQELAIGDSAEAFAERCVEIYTTAGKWTSLRSAALRRIGAECSQETFESKVYDILPRDKAEHGSGTTRFVNVGMDR